MKVLVGGGGGEAGGMGSKIAGCVIQEAYS